MESPILRQIAKFLQERKNQKRWKVVFVCLAVIVGAGTVIGLRMMGLAMTHKERVLDCQYEVHKHEETCYDEENNLICGYADYVVHKHNDDCYNADLKLVCPLPEIEKHEHTKECYNEMVLLVCGQEEAAGHEHTDACYTKKKGSLACTAEEHKHTDACYDEEKNLTCDLEEHTHDDNCYNWEDVLTCTLPAGEGGHKHTEACYQKQEGLTCGQLEMHTHTEKCFEKIDKDGTDEPDNLRLVCDKVELTEHVHTEAFGCLKTVEVAPGETAEEAAEKDAENDGVFTTDLNGEGENGADGAAAEGEDNGAVGDGTGETAEGEEGADGEGAGTDGETAEGESGETAGDGTGEAAEGADGEEAGGEEPEGSTNPEDYEETKTYEGLGYIVSASYNKDANIPEEAKLIAEQITEVSDSEDYKKHEAEFKKNMGDENATMSALFKIGFYVDNEEVEPESPVLVTIQFVDKHGLPEGAPIKVVHFGDEATEVIDGGKAESGSTSFKTKGFSKFAIGFGKEKDEKEEDAEKVPVYISETAIYEDDVFTATFHIEGDVKVAKEEEKSILSAENEAEEDKEAVPEETTDTNDKTAREETGNEKEAENPDAVESEDGEQTADSSETIDTPEQIAPEEDNSEKLKFEVKALGEESEEYAAAAEYVEQEDKENKADDMLRLQLLTCSLTYNGEELDISDCKVTAEITTAPSLNDQAKESIPETVKQILGEEKVEEIGEKAIEKKTAIMVKAMKVNGRQIDSLGDAFVNQREADEPIEGNIAAQNENIAMAALARKDVQFTVQYYAYAQILEDQAQTGDGTDTEAITIINTNIGEGLGGAKLPSNNDKPLNTKNLYVKPAKNQEGTTWPAYDPVYKDKNTTDSLTKLYTASQYEFREVASGLDHINKFAKAGLNYDLFEIWVMQDSNSSKNINEDGTKKADGTNKDDWEVYSGEQLKNIQFTNSEQGVSQGAILITDDTVIRLVGKSNIGKKDYPTLFFDYDITNGTASKDDDNRVKRKGINSVENYPTPDKAPRYGFGNGAKTSGSTGVEDDLLDGHNFNQAVAGAKTIREKCAFGIVEKDALSENGYPIIRANAPDLFNPTKEEMGKTVINGRALSFDRDGDTYTLTSVAGSGAHAQNLNKFQKYGSAWGVSDTVWSNQFWPMDNAETFGAAGHDPRFGTQAQYNQTGLVKADDGKEHNSFFGMNFEVEFSLTDDYAGPLNYCFFGDDDMWVFLEHPDGRRELICDIGGVHQAAGEYVDLWNYIEKPTDNATTNRPGTEEERTKSYKLKFFYTERGASGSTCWMQFTLPSVNSVPVKDYTGNVKSTLTVKKEISGEVPEEILNERFEFEITFTGDAENIGFNTYPFEIKNANGEVVEKGDISSGGKFMLSHNQTIEVFNLPDNTRYTIKEADYAGYDPELENKSEGVIMKDETVEGNIDWDREDKFDFVNKQVQYELPETGGSGMVKYTIAGAICILLGAGFMYTKKAKERRV